MLSAEKSNKKICIRTKSAKHFSADVIDSGNSILTADNLNFTAFQKFEKLLAKATKAKDESRSKLLEQIQQLEIVTKAICNWAEASTAAYSELPNREKRKVAGQIRLAIGIPDHDINNRITVLTGHSEILREELQEGTPLDEQRRGIIDKLYYRIENDVILIPNLLRTIGYFLNVNQAAKQADFLRYDTSWPNLQKAINDRDLYTRFKRTIILPGGEVATDHISRIRFLTEPEFTDQISNIEHFCLHQALRNARRYAENTIKVQAFHFEGQRVLVVKDDGPGIRKKKTKDEIEKLGKALPANQLDLLVKGYSTKERGGLGLDSVSLLQEMSGGSMLILSQPEKNDQRVFFQGKREDSPEYIERLIARIMPPAVTGTIVAITTPLPD